MEPRRQDSTEPRLQASTALLRQVNTAPLHPNNKAGALLPPAPQEATRLPNNNNNRAMAHPHQHNPTAVADLLHPPPWATAP
jgi:cell division protein FtsN